jgi:hypothetical protein
MDKAGSESPPDRESGREDISDSDLPKVYSPYLPADLEHWSKTSYWEPIEAACLSLGYGPILIQNASEEQLHCEPDTLEQIRKRFQLTTRAATSEALRAQAAPHDWLTWFSEMGISVAEGLADWVEKVPNFGNLGFIPIRNDQAETIMNGIASIKHTISSAPYETRNPSSSTKEIQSLEKMVIAMAIAGYAYDPLGRRSSVPKEIADDAAKNGIQLGEDTARKYINRAAENHLPQSD